MYQDAYRTQVKTGSNFHFLASLEDYKDYKDYKNTVVSKGDFTLRAFICIEATVNIIMVWLNHASSFSCTVNRVKCCIIFLG